MGEQQPKERYRISWEVIVTVVAWLVGGMLAYGSLDARIQVLEDRYNRISIDMLEIKTDIKTLLRESRQP